MVFDAMSKYTSGDLTLNLFGHLQNGMNPGIKDNSKSNLPTLKQASEHLVIRAMDEAGQNQSAAAKILGISQQALSKRLLNLKQKK